MGQILLFAQHMFSLNLKPNPLGIFAVSFPESAKIQYYGITLPPNYWNKMELEHLCKVSPVGLFSTKSNSIQQDQLLEFDGFGVVGEMLSVLVLEWLTS